MVYNPATDPVDKIFTDITYLEDFSIAAGAPMTMQQKINLAYVILKKARVFNEHITTWNRLIRVTPTDNTWDNFKSYFRNAYRELKEVGELSARDTPYNQANLVCQIVDAVQESLANNEGQRNEAPPRPAANSTTQTTPPVQSAPMFMPMSDPNQLNALFQQMMLQNMMGNMNNGNNNNSNNNSNRNRNNRRNNNRNRDRRQIQMRYCWSCGWCTHDGDHCRNRKEGHQTAATVDNRMGGSTNGLPPGYA